LEAIRDFIARDSAHYAKLVVQRIVATIDLLATSRGWAVSFRSCEMIHVRELIVGAYRIVYRYRHDTIEIVTIFDGTRLLRGDIIT
jgi:plasmid stabilization system protein ParE